MMIQIVLVIPIVQRQVSVQMGSIVAMGMPMNMTQNVPHLTHKYFDGAFEGTFFGSMVFNILQSQSVTQWCVGSIELNSTVNGYERASVSGIGECQNASGSLQLISKFEVPYLEAMLRKVSLLVRLFIPFLNWK